MQYIKMLLLLSISMYSYSYSGEAAMQPPTIEYNYCNHTGTSCSRTEVEYAYDNGQKVAISGGINEDSREQLINLDHYYRSQCNKELGILITDERTKELTARFRECLIRKLDFAIQNRNKENLDYLKKTKEIFK